MTSATRLKILVGIAALIGIYAFATSGNQAGDDGVIGARDSGAARTPATGSSSAAAQKSSATADEEQLLGNRPARNVSSAKSTLTAGDVTALLARMNHRVVAHSDGGVLFGRQSWYVAPPPPPPAPVVYTPPPKPTAPPLPFGVMGSYARPGAPTVYFLTRGERVFDVRVGDTIDNTYKVDSEGNGQLLLTYQPLNIQQSLPIGGAR